MHRMFKPAAFCTSLAVLAVAAVPLASCSKGSEDRPAQTGQGQYVPQGSSSSQTGYGGQVGYGGQPSYGAPNYGAPTSYAGQPTMQGADTGAGQPAMGQSPGALGPVPADPNTLQNIIAGALSGGAAALGALTGGELPPIQQGIKSKASTVAKGKKPDGELMSAKLQQGAHAESSITLQPGSCYTIIGFAGFGVFDYQINLMTSPPMPPQILAQSPAGGIDPVLGPNTDCVKNPYPVPMIVKVDLVVLRGQGMVGAQVYK